jgi:glycosyltransferase involved in cell wall biosynthesis
MKIAQIAPLYESVPPKLYGGTERIVSYLTEELVRQGHDVTLFASGDSHTAAKLIAPCASAVRLDPRVTDPIVSHMLLLEEVFSRSREFDLIHSHLDYWTFALARRQATPVLTTLHGRLDLPELGPFYEEFNDRPVVSISNAQRSPLPQACWQGTVYHGLPLSLLSFNPRPGSYLAFLGRISIEKRVDRAIQIAEAAGIPLRIAAKVDAADRDYYHSVIKPLLKTVHADFIGEITELQKGPFLGGALGLLFPIDWPEPFGLVLIEAMACGTPVVAYRRGSVPEIIEDGVTGFIVDNEAQAVQAVHKLPQLSRARVRERFEQRFSDKRMTRDYLLLYEQLASRPLQPLN